jgi:EAL domain-containing protein (putative c-di-GMP-specific phosphodiesterase class I)/DNA-binding response OmpR family regulator
VSIWQAIRRGVATAIDPSPAPRRAAPGGSPGASASGAPPVDELPSGRPVVLIADDQPSIRTLLQRVLEREGFQTILASNGREALDQIHRQDVALLLLDVHMPVMDGFETLRAIRTDDRSRTLPVILVTGANAEADRVSGLEAGADDFLAKPIQIKELAARVRSQIRARTAWTDEVARGREYRRRLAAALDRLPVHGSLVDLASGLASRLPAVLDVDGVAILHFSRGTVRPIAASGALRAAYPLTKALSRDVGREIVSRAEVGVWLDAPTGQQRSGAEPLDTAFVPFKLGPESKPLGCLVYGQRTGAVSGPLSHRLPDLIDATDYIVAVLRPAVEKAETDDAGVARLQHVIARRAYAIHLQPVVHLDSGTVVATEALTRFTDGVRPDVRFAEAAALGFGIALERATLIAAIAAAAALPADVALSVNLSADVLQHDPRLPRIIAGAGRPIIVELTEHERIDDYPAVRAAFGRLGANARLAVDDAGSGFASLRHILALQPSFVKLDIEWVRGIDRDPVRRALVTGLAYFAAETGCELIAEGIETEEERRTITELGVRLGQGFLLGRPVPPQPADQVGRPGLD